MTGALALSAALLALYGIAHCAAMCGGFVAATFASPSGSRAGTSPFLAALAMHAGRLASYSAAGALAGAIGATPAMVLGSARVHSILFSLGALALIVTGLRIAGVGSPGTTGTAFAEPLWRRVSAMARRLGTADSWPKRLGLGLLWGWAPCALVYSALPLALVSGSSMGGALVMLAFGAGTLPALLGAGWLFGRSAALSPGPVTRRIAGGAIMVLAIAGILQALGVADTPLGAFCVSPAP
jgi:uncharacterized protein